MEDISFPSGKIPINILEKYSYCKKQWILSLRLEYGNIILRISN